MQVCFVAVCLTPFFHVTTTTKDGRRARAPANTQQSNVKGPSNCGGAVYEHWFFAIFDQLHRERIELRNEEALFTRRQFVRECHIGDQTELGRNQETDI